MDFVLLSIVLQSRTSAVADFIPVSAKRLLPTNCLSVFHHFVRLMRKGLLYQPISCQNSASLLPGNVGKH